MGMTLISLNYSLTMNMKTFKRTEYKITVTIMPSLPPYKQLLIQYWQYCFAADK